MIGPSIDNTGAGILDHRPSGRRIQYRPSRIGKDFLLAAGWVCPARITRQSVSYRRGSNKTREAFFL